MRRVRSACVAAILPLLAAGCLGSGDAIEEWQYRFDVFPDPNGPDFPSPMDIGAIVDAQVIRTTTGTQMVFEGVSMRKTTRFFGLLTENDTWATFERTASEFLDSGDLDVIDWSKVHYESGRYVIEMELVDCVHRDFSPCAINYGSRFDEYAFEVRSEKVRLGPVSADVPDAPGITTPTTRPPAIGLPPTPTITPEPVRPPTVTTPRITPPVDEPSELPPATVPESVPDRVCPPTLTTKVPRPTLPEPRPPSSPRTTISDNCRDVPPVRS